MVSEYHPEFNTEVITGTPVAAGRNVAWTGEKWDLLGGVMDMSSYLTEEDLPQEASNEDIDNAINALLN